MNLLKKNILRYLSKKYYHIKHAIITVPTNFFHLQIEGILDACKASGLDIEEEEVIKIEKRANEKLGREINGGIILDEPSAAALYFLDAIKGIKPDAFDRLKKGNNLHMLIYDHGGGTLDVSVIKVENIEDKGFLINVLANKGNNKIGGDSIDLVLMNDLLKKCKLQYPKFEKDLISSTYNKLLMKRYKEEWSAEIWSNILRVRGNWKKIAEQAKEDLSTKDNTSINVDLSDIFILDKKNIDHLKDFNITISRSTFEDLIGEIIKESEYVIKGAIELANISYDKIDFIIHTGRSSIIPAIKNRVTTIFPHISENQVILHEERLKICVAKGAVMYALPRNKNKNKVFIVDEGKKLPHSYGIDKPDEDTGTSLVYDEIIKIGTKYPTDNPITKHFNKDDIEGNKLRLNFYQNSGKHKSFENNRDINKIGDVSIPISEDKPECVLKFEINKNRKLAITANDKEIKIRPPKLDENEEWM